MDEYSSSGLKMKSKDRYKQGQTIYIRGIERRTNNDTLLRQSHRHIHQDKQIHKKKDKETVWQQQSLKSD